MDHKGSSHVGSPDYDAEITPEGGKLTTHPRKLSGGCSVRRSDFSKRFWNRGREGVASGR
jgi:hypothetical protein